MNELLKRLSVGALIGLLVGLVIGFGTNIDGFFLTDLLSGYEYQSYDARMRASVAGSEEASIDTVVIIDIEQQSLRLQRKEVSVAIIIGLKLIMGNSLMLSLPVSQRLYFLI